MDEKKNNTSWNELAAKTGGLNIKPTLQQNSGQKLPREIIDEVISYTLEELKEHPDVFPDGVKGNKLYEVCFRNRPSEVNGGEMTPAIALHVPRKRGNQRLEEIIAQTAERLVIASTGDQTPPKEWIEIAQLGLTENLNDTFHVIDRSPFIKIENAKFSPNEGRLATKATREALDKGLFSEQDAIVALLWKLGIYTSEEIQDRCDGPTAIRTFEDLSKINLRPLREEVRESAIWARSFLHHLIEKRLNPAIAKYAKTGEITGTVKIPSLNQRLRCSSIFNMVEVFYDSNSSERDVNDAQMSINLMIAHWFFSRRQKKLENSKIIKQIDSQMIETLFGSHDEETVNDTSQTMLAYDPDERAFEKTGVTIEQECRTLITSEEYADIPPEKKRVFLYEMGSKEIPSQVLKQLRPDHIIREADEMPDEIRTRIVTWTVSSSEMAKDSRWMEMYAEKFYELAESLELCDWALHNDLDHPNYPKLALLGKAKNGGNVEIQLIPIDTYLFEQAYKSPMSHEVMEAVREWEYLLVAIAASISEITHLVGRKELSRLKAERKACGAARKKILEEGSI